MPKCWSWSYHELWRYWEAVRGYAPRVRVVALALAVHWGACLHRQCCQWMPSKRFLAGMIPRDEQVSKSTECVVSVTVRQSTLSGEHKVKVQGLFLSDDDAARQMATRGVIDTVVEGLG